MTNMAGYPISTTICNGTSSYDVLGDYNKQPNELQKLNKAAMLLLSR